MEDRGESERSSTARHECGLLAAATTLARAGDLQGLLGAVRDATAMLDGCHLGGLGIYDVRRGVLVVYGSRGAEGRREGQRSAGLSSEGEEFAISDTEAAGFLDESATCLSPDLQSGSCSPLQRRFHEVGVRRYVCVPLKSGDQLLGALYACFRDSAAPRVETVSYIERLAHLLTPALWNFRTRARLAKGDRRRATLIELSHAINTSLRLGPVLRSAGRAVAGLEGHRLSIIGLLDEGAGTFRAYSSEQPAEQDRDLPTEPEHVAVGATALSWVIEHEETYESDDLARGGRFDQDSAFRAAAVRRYVAAPLFVRGKIIGAFFFGTQDPHPALTTDVWLYENIALQLALAIDNAQQFEALRQLTDELKQQNVYLREEIDTAHDVEGMIGRSPGMQRVFDEITRVAGTDSSVLIMGETGVGKELVARAIHARSARARHPMVKINCAAIPEGLVESELFGHERGAFTSATSRRIGRFELARDGTLFLDEVGELPPAVQAKLLRVLQDGQFERVGGTDTLDTDARIIAATNRNLAKAVENGAFRSDLYYRLNVFPIHVPPLSERREDIPLLVEALIAQFNRQMGKAVHSIDPASLDDLCQRRWHGNVRELRHVIERAMILCDGSRLTIEPAHDESTGGARLDVPAAPQAPPSPSTKDDARGLRTLREAEREHIRRALEQTGGVIDGSRGAAALLGLKPSTLRSRMKRLGISRRS